MTQPEESVKYRKKSSVASLRLKCPDYAGTDVRNRSGTTVRIQRDSHLIKDPKLIFLDEPTIGLDPDGTNRMLDLIHNLSRERGITTFLSSHLLDQVQRICERVGIMIKGKLVAVGSIDELAKKKLGLEENEAYTLEEIYMKYFKEA